MNEVPGGWSAASVLELADLIRGVSYAKGEAETTPAKGRIALLANNINGELVFKDLQFVPQNRVGAEQMLQAGDVVLAMSSGSKSVVGKAASVVQAWEGTFGAFCGVLRPNRQFDSNYFGYFFQTKEYRNAISEASAGTNINNLKREYFRELELPFPPLAEQKRIVAKVAQLLARVSAARARLAKVPAILKRFRQSVLAAACSGRLTADWRIVQQFLPGGAEFSRTVLPTVDVNHSPGLPELWTWAALSTVVVRVKRGPSLKCNQDKLGIRYITSGNLEGGELRLDRDQKYLAGFEGVEKCRLLPDDLILNCVNSLDQIGKTAVFRANHGDAIVGFNNYALELEREVVHSEYANLFCQTAMFRQNLKLIVKHAVNQVSFATKELKLITLPLPPIPEQQEIVRRVEALFRLADAIEKRLATATARVDKLTQAILAKAFRGELVPTEADLARAEGRDYEPASMLLGRIRAERGGQADAGNPARRGPRRMKSEQPNLKR